MHSFEKFKEFYLYVYECFTCVHVSAAHGCCAHSAQGERVGPFGTRVTDGREPNSLQNQQVLLTTCRPSSTQLVLLTIDSSIQHSN